MPKRVKSQDSKVDALLRRVTSLEAQLAQPSLLTSIETVKPTLIQVGKHFVDPTDIAAIARVRNDLYVVRLKSQPNPQYPMWVRRENIGSLLGAFNLVEEAVQGEDD